MRHRGSPELTSGTGATELGVHRGPRLGWAWALPPDRSPGDWAHVPSLRLLPLSRKPESWVGNQPKRGGGGVMWVD